MSERHNPFLRPLKKKGFKEERITTMGVDDIGTSHDPGIQQEPVRIVARECVRFGYRTIMNRLYAMKDMEECQVDSSRALSPRKCRKMRQVATGGRYYNDTSPRRGNMAKRHKQWIYSPPRPPKPKVPELVKRDVETRAHEFVESVLKPKHLTPAPQGADFKSLVARG